MIMRQCRLLLLPILCLASTGRLEAEGLQQAWSVALATNHELRAASQRGDAAEREWAAARAAWLPSVTLEGGYMRLEEAPGLVIGLTSVAVPLTLSSSQRDFSAYGALVRQPLWTSGRITQGIAAAEALSDAAGEDERTVVLDLKLKVAKAYVLVLRAERAVDVADALVASLRAHGEDVRHLFDEGFIAKNDLLASKVALAFARQRSIQAGNALDLASSAYNRLLGRALDTPVDLDELEMPEVETKLEELSQLALSQRPELAGLEQRRIALQHRAGMIRGESLPQVALFGGYAFLESSLLEDESNWSAGIGLKWELFDGGRKRRLEEASRSEASAVAEMGKEAASQIALQVRKAWLDLDETRERIAVAAEAVAHAEENLSVASDRYANGLGTNTDVLDAQTRLAQSRSDIDNATYDAVVAALELERATGTL